MQGEHRPRIENTVRGDGNFDLIELYNIQELILPSPIIAQPTAFGKIPESGLSGFVDQCSIGSKELTQFFPARVLSSASTENVATSPPAVFRGWPSFGPNAVP